MNLPLGLEADYPHKYSPDVLCPISRSTSRDSLGLTGAMPFAGVDIWNAWELTWLGTTGLPEAATAEISVPADSANIIESKSLKLYLGSFAMSRFDSAAIVSETIAADLGQCAGAAVDVRVLPVSATEVRRAARLAGACLDTLEVTCSEWEVNPDLLRSDAGERIREDLHTHLLRSLCPVTAQPDIGSLQISYSGPRIDPAALLQYVVSFREHNDFHEACVERMFVDLLERCDCAELTLHARYQRRGGIDINPVRSNCGETPRNLRLWRQ